VCQTQQIAIGPTGPTGTTGTTNIIPGAMKAFTLFLDYSTANAISRVYVPPGLFSPANPTLAAGGIFTADQGTDLIFLGSASPVLNNTAYPFAVGINCSGYISAGRWQPILGGNIGPGVVNYSVVNDYSVNLYGLDLANINGASVAPKPTTGVAAGFLATITIFYV